ncbi:hypothetical protein Q7P35_011593 [Cladosporium inversicolor]
MWYLRASPARPRAVLDRLDCLWISSRHKSSLDLGYEQPKWTKEEDKKLLELYDQAAREKCHWPAFVVKGLGNRSITAVKDRIYAHRHGAIAYGSYRKWTEDEISTIRKKLQQGVPLRELSKHLPSRSFSAIKERVLHLRSVPSTTRAIPFGRQEFTDDQIQRVIHMRLREQKSRAEVAAELNCHLSEFKRLWRARCAPLLSHSELESIRAFNYWTQEETDRLTELYTWTTLSRSDVALQFPSRGKSAVDTKIERLQLASARKQRQAALKNEASRSTPAATPVTHQRPGQALGGLGQRRMFSSSSYASSKYWSADEDLKLLDLRQRGLRPRDIAMLLEGRTIPSVIRRTSVLKSNPSTKTRQRWSPQENATVLENMRQGLTIREISPLLPGRSFHAIETKAQALRLAEDMGTKSGQPRRLTDAEIQLMIEMRLREHKTLPEIATQLGRHYRYIQQAWSRQCSPLVSEEALRSIYRMTRQSWSENELEHLAELYNRGNMPQKEIALHFPSRTHGAIKNKIYLLDKPRREKKPSKTREPKDASPRQSRKSSSPRGLQSTRPTVSMPDSIESTSRRAFSSSSRASLKAKVKIWTQDEDRKILELARQGLGVPRIAAGFGGDISPSHIERRLRVLRLGKPAVRSREKWTPAEDALLIQMKQDGLRVEEIAAQLPGRTVSAVQGRWTNHIMQRAPDSRQVKPLPLKRSGTEWSDAELQRVIDLRVKERKSLIDIARDLGRSISSVRKVWHKGAALLPHETLQEVWGRSNWSPDETKRLIHL